MSQSEEQERWYWWQEERHSREETETGAIIQRTWRRLQTKEWRDWRGGRSPAFVDESVCLWACFEDRTAEAPWKGIGSGGWGRSARTKRKLQTRKCVFERERERKRERYLEGPKVLFFFVLSSTMDAHTVCLKFLCGVQRKFSISFALLITFFPTPL